MLDFGFYNMDCMEGMKECPDKFFDLAIVDPPYGIGVGSMAYTNGVQIVGNALAKRTDRTDLTDCMNGIRKSGSSG